jgi:hypothetical protein
MLVIPSLPLTTTIPFVSSGWLASPLHLLPFATLHYMAPFLYLQGCLILPRRFLFLGGGHGERGNGSPLSKGSLQWGYLRPSLFVSWGCSPWAPPVMGLPLVKGVRSGDTCALGL